MVPNIIPPFFPRPYYSPGLATLRYDKQPIKYNPAFKAVFDSGATYTYMPGQIYSDLLSKVDLKPQSTLMPIHLNRDNNMKLMACKSFRLKELFEKQHLKRFKILLCLTAGKEKCHSDLSTM